MFHLTLRMDLSGSAALAVAPLSLIVSLHHPLFLPLFSLSLFLLVSLAQASSLSGGVCTSSWCVSCSAAWYCSVMAAVARRAAGHIHTHTHRREESLPRDSLFIPHITILPVSGREQGQVGRGGYVLLFHPGAPSKRLGIAFTVMTSGTFPFPSNQKMPRD